MHKRMGQSARKQNITRSAQILIVIGKAFKMHVNARSSNHDPNHVLDHDPKRDWERDSSPCEHSPIARSTCSNVMHTLSLDAPVSAYQIIFHVIFILHQTP